MIPRKIHYCWLSGDPYPKAIGRCMESWRRFLPGYEFVLWNMEKARGIGSRWIDQAVGRSNWAFAADYVRLWALHQEGGIYLDCDVEVLKDFSPLMSRPLMLGREGGTGLVEAAVIGAEKGDARIAKVLGSFEDELTPETLPARMKRILGDEVELLPSDYFSPKDWRTGYVAVTGNTYAVHHFEGSWLSPKERWAARMGRTLGLWSVPCTRWLFARFGK